MWPAGDDEQPFPSEVAFAQMDTSNLASSRLARSANLTSARAQIELATVSWLCSRCMRSAPTGDRRTHEEQWEETAAKRLGRGRR